VTFGVQPPDRSNIKPNKERKSVFDMFLVCNDMTIKTFSPSYSGLCSQATLCSKKVFDCHETISFTFQQGTGGKDSRLQARPGDYS
jgi:hypothetical protein